MKTDASTEQPPSLPTEDVTTQLINQLDELLHALSKSIPATKPWSRQLQEHLREADRAIETLRLTLLLKRPSVEMAAAAFTVRSATAAMDAAAAGGRVDLTTRSALRLAHRLGQTLVRDFQVTPNGA
ncbi:hypothetical protein [Roseateles flavus]|uniref:Uncharacterized protein n=1 Tax=Roseateles flavus TaxID=3149041 RepID=A0ABV0GKU1_9BURK